MPTLSPFRRRTKAPEAIQVDWERRRAYTACLKAEQALEMAALTVEASQVRKIRQAL